MGEEQQAEGLETEDKGAGVADQFAAADAAADPNAEVMPLEEIASKLGWVPEDKYEGPKEKWKPADKFIIDGKKIQERQARDLKGIRETLENIKQTSGAIMADKLRETHEKYAQQYAAAVEKGDPDEAWKASNAIRNLQEKANAPAPIAGPAPETEEWVKKNGRVMADPRGQLAALQICDAYARKNPNSSPAEQLAYTEGEMRREFPHLFDDKGPASVSAPGSRSSAAPAKGANTAANLPKEAKEHGQDLVERGMIPNLDAYAKHYFEQLEKRK